MAVIKGAAAETVGVVLSRIVVPLWILMGAVFKLIERTPSNLPSSFVAGARDLGIDLGLLLRTLIALELIAVLAMLLVGRIARAVAIFMLSVFCVVLIVELYRNAQSCGCFGSIKLHPGVMLAIDGTLLLGVILFGPRRDDGSQPVPRLAFPALVALSLAAVAVSYALPNKSTDAPPDPGPGVVLNGGNVGDDEAPAIAAAEGCSAWPEAIPIPGFWYAKDLGTWPGRCWNELELFKIIRDKPRDLHEGRKIVVLYRRDCDHCETMFIENFLGQLETPVVAYRIPSPTDWPLPPGVTADLRDLSADCDWVIETPLVVTLEDGEVVCAVEGEGAEECLN